MQDYKYFTSKELTCRCGCGLLNISDQFMRRIVRSRKFAIRLCRRFGSSPYNARFVVTSGCRCLDYNKKISLLAPLSSSHIATENSPSSALDIAFEDNKQLLIIITALFICGKFTHIGVNLKKKFIHVDCGDRWLFFY